MVFERDIDLIKDIVLGRDLSFAGLDRLRVADSLQTLNNANLPHDAFLLTAMRSLALTRNGHTRLVPNAAIRIHPVRFVALGSGIYLTAAPSVYQACQDMPLVAINDVAIEDVFARFEPYLAGNMQRQRVIGALLLAWPAALNAVEVVRQGRDVTYTFQPTDSTQKTVTMVQHDLVPGQDLYPYFEQGQLQASEKNPICHRTMPSDVTYIAFPDFIDTREHTLEADVARAVQSITKHPDHDWVVDVRGNPGGSFLWSLPFVEALKTQWRGKRCAVLTDKFTFSAGIVFVALLKHALADRLTIIGEGMGDNLQFFAEGGLQDLPDTGAMIRYSDAFHDWQTGTAHPSTPDIIAQHLVGVGGLTPDVTVDISATHKRHGRDPQFEAALSALL
ncbi:peptidase S41 [uncultured Tateyamaria sp.]|uniref:peptidase S41 n=1 Tax=uncultured Tateyamaria sp. TaxID=455651 RepID=UPI0026147CF6|nr:peptidase S41 [uncultured Tateyamaria sp.]